MNKRGQVTFYLLFIGISLAILFIGAFVAPFGAAFASQVYTSGNGMLLTANETLSQIQDPTIRQKAQDVIQGGIDSTYTNIEVNTAIYKYSWAFVLLIGPIRKIIFTRKLSEYNQGVVWTKQ